MRIAWKQFRILIAVTILLYIATFIPIVKDFVRYSAAPFIQFTRLKEEALVDSIKVLFSISSLARENGELNAKVNELSSVTVLNAELRHENDLLRKELSLTSEGRGTNLIAAQVISRTSSVSQQSIVVNKGHEDGFAEGMAVIAQGYLVGRVSEVSPHTSRVMLLSSVQSLMPVVLQNSRAVGLLRGGAEGLVIDEIPRDITIAPGEAIVTSNIGDVVKSGLPVGMVATVLSGESDVFQSVRVTSPIDLSRLEIVFGVR